MCADPRHPRTCLGPKAKSTAAPGPGCGQPNHPATCLCDVQLGGKK